MGATMRITIACPQAHIADANHLAMALGYSNADDQTYGGPTWQDANGNLYAVASLDVSPLFVHAAGSPLQRPEWDADSVVDMVAAGRAQARIVIWGITDGEADPVATTDVILAMFHPDPLAALALAGLKIIQNEVTI